MNNTFEIVVYWSEQDGHFLAEVPDLPGIITEVATRVKVLRHAEEMIDAYLTAAHEPRGKFLSRKVGWRLREG